MDKTDAADQTVVNVILIFVFTIFSIVLSVVAVFLLKWGMGQTATADLVLFVALVAGVTSFTVAVPGVLFADVMIERLRDTRQELNAALVTAKAASRAKSEFLANMSHEIRTPLNGVLGMTQVLKTTSLDAKQENIVSILDDSGRLLSALVNDVLDLSKIEAGKVEIEPVVDSPAQAVERVVRIFDAKAAEQGTQLSVRVDSDVPGKAVFDPTRVRQCVANLVSNAVKFTEEGEVAVRVSAAPATSAAYEIRVAVRDTGIGLSEDAQRKLFQAFNQADASTNRKYGGTGLGLAISRNLARLMGGDITVASRPGEGSVFTLSFSAEEPSVMAAPDSGTRQLRALPPSLKVLVVDDNLVNRQVVKLLLEPHGVECDEAENGAHALEVLQRGHFDLVLLDVHMPVMDGPETLREIRKSRTGWSSIPVIALTADAMSGERERLLNIGMDGYATKPVRLEELTAEMSLVLDQTADAAMVLSG